MPEPPGLAASFTPDPPLGRFDNNVARLGVTAGHWADYQRAAETVAAAVTATATELDRFLPADLPADAGAAARPFVESFGTRAFRRPLESAEIDRYTALFALGPDHYPELDARTAGIRLVLEAILQSPHFLYRIESSTRVVGGLIQLSGWEVASRLSYALWDTMPDDALLAAAASGALDGEDGVRAQAARLFDDPRTREQFARFHTQAFAFDEYTDIDKDMTAFPEWSPDLALAMQREAELFVDGIVFEGGGIADFLTSTTAFVNADLAAIYGVTGDFGTDFQEVTLDPTRRSGFLTRAGFLTQNATLRDPDPIHRGVFANLRVLCREISAVPNLPDDLMPVGDTNRERIESINGVGTCGEGCHPTIINPLGFALEHYDALGKWREDDNGFAINTVDTYVFADGRMLTFQDGIDLSTQLAQQPEVHACYVGQMLEFIAGRDLVEEDQPLVDALVSESLEGTRPVKDLAVEILTSRTFRFRAPE